MAEFEITERTEAFTLDEVFSFIDDTNISKMDAHELKSRIADAVKEIRAQAIDEFVERLSEKSYFTRSDDFVVDVKAIEELAEQMKGGAE